MNLDERLNAASHVAWVEEVISIVRHDSVNKLGSVRNASYYLRRKISGSAVWEEDVRIPKFFDLIDKELDAAHEVLQDGNATHRLFERRSEDVSLAQVLDRIRVRHPDLRVDVGDQSVHADPSELELLLQCLVTNCLDAQGTPTIDVVTENGVLIRVIDTGHGFTQSPCNRAFEAFVTTRAGRPGLGLTIARRIARRYAGTMRIALTSPTQTIVEVSFPAEKT